jgi:hypothetical protein
MWRPRAEGVRGVIATYFADQGFAVPESDWILREDAHEGLPPGGSWSLACEGDVPSDWAVEVTGDKDVRAELQQRRERRVPTRCGLG